MKIYLSPSRQTSNIGLYKSYNLNECLECEAIAKYTKEYLEKYYCEVLISNREDKSEARGIQANEWGADFYLPIHTNASSVGSAKGCETYYLNGDTTGRNFANILYSNIKSLVGYGRKTKANDNLAEFKYANCPKAYIEVDFHTNSEATEWLVNNQQLIGETIGKTFVEVFDIPMRTVEEEEHISVVEKLVNKPEFKSTFVRILKVLLKKFLEWLG